MSTLTSKLQTGTFTRSNLRLRLSRFIDRMNARIDAQPMPRQHRMGSWQASLRDDGKK